MHRTTLMFLLLAILTGTLIAVTSKKWFIIWVGLETRTLAIIPILCSKFSPRKVEATIKYFLIQAMRAAILLKGALIQAWLTGSWSILEPINMVTSISMVAALSFKIGLAPCHFWLPDVLQGLPYSTGLIIATWQKIAPLIVLFSIKNLIFSKLVIVVRVLSILIGGWGGLNQTQTRKILAFSSIANMGWIAITSIYSYDAALAMLVIYLTIKTAIFLVFDFLKVLTLGHLNATSQLSSSRIIIIILVILSLGGLPPLTGFMLKFFSLHALVSKNFIIPLVVLVIGALLSLFFYLRIAFKARLILFPHHIITLSSWRRKVSYRINSQKTWLISCLFVARTITIPLALPLYIII